MFCQLWEQYHEDPGSFTPARHAVLRGYMSELGLSDFRSRIGQEEEDDDGDQAGFEDWWKAGKPQEGE